MPIVYSPDEMLAACADMLETLKRLIEQSKEQEEEQNTTET